MKFSVLLPTFNGGQYLAHTINSVLDQPYSNLELIVSNNCSTDETQNVLKSFSGDPRLKVVKTEKTISVAANWNFAFKASSGDYILLIGDDDCLLPGYFEKMEKILEQYGYPEAITCNGYGYITPGSIYSNAKSSYQDPFYEYGPEFKKGLLSQKMRYQIVSDMFRFRVRFPLNIQPHLMSRTGINRVKGDIYRLPFPDHYALNSLLLRAKTWLFYPEKLFVVGVTPNSCGFHYYNNDINGALDYLGLKIEGANFLPGSMLINGMHTWLNLLKTDHNDKLGNINICRAGYVRRQVYSWYLEYKAGVTKPKDLLHRFTKLSFGDWIGLMASIFDKKSWEQVWSILSRQRSNPVKNSFPRSIPINEIGNIKEFADWISNGKTNPKP